MNSRVHSSLETMVSRSHHWLHQFQLVTEHSLKDATNYNKRATGVGTKHAVLRPRPRPWDFRSRDQGRDLGQNKLECTRVSRPWSRDHNTGAHHEQQELKIKDVWRPTRASRKAKLVTLIGFDLSSRKS